VKSRVILYVKFLHQQTKALFMIHVSVSLPTCPQLRNVSAAIGSLCFTALALRCCHLANTSTLLWGERLWQNSEEVIRSPLNLIDWSLGHAPPLHPPKHFIKIRSLLPEMLHCKMSFYAVYPLTRIKNSEKTIHNPRKNPHRR